MKRLLVLAILALAGWQAWKHHADVLHRAPSHQAVVDNRSGRTIERLRLMVGNQTFVREVLTDGERATFPFRVNHDETFRLNWAWEGKTGEADWSGGLVPRGPIVQRYRFTIVHGGGVIIGTEELAAGQ